MDTATTTSAPYVDPFDLLSDDARELVLYADNTSELYPDKCAIVRRLMRKIAKGTYSPALAPRAWRPWLDDAARMYRREIGPTEFSFPAKVRQEAAEYLAATEHAAILNGEWSFVAEEQ